MAESTITPSQPQTIATTNPSQGDPVIARGFDDPKFLQGIDKAFADAKLQREQMVKPIEEREIVEVPGPDDREVKGPPGPEPKEDRPPTPRKASEWAAFHDAKVKIERERDELKSKLEKLNGFDPKEYEETKAERQKLSEKLEAIALERSDKFQKYFNDSADNIRALVKSAVGDKADKVIRLLDMPDSDWRTEQLEALTEELTPLRRAKMERAFADMDKLAIERNKVIENSQENWKKLQQAEKMERDHKQEQSLRIFDSEIKTMSDPEKGLAPFQTKDGDAAWNKGVKDRIEKARAIYAGDISPEEKARYAAFSSALPEFENTFTALLKENTSLKEELSKLRTSEPGLEQGKQQDTGSNEYKGMDHGNVLARMIEKAGGFSGR